MRVLVLVIVVVTWESKANSSSTGNELQTGTELGKNVAKRGKKAQRRGSAP